ncbi:amidase [Pseudomonas sp. TE21394]
MKNLSSPQDPSFEHERIFTVLLDTPSPCDGPLAGLSVSVKDNIDVAGLVTTAGAKAFQHNPPAMVDAPVVARLKAAGAKVFARTNMSEFAYSTHGINSHFGTPVNPWENGSGPRIPGGSSSGAAVAIARGIGDVAIGTDTSGSARVPAALCGVVGFKPRQRRIPIEGIVPLAPTYDCVGIIARNVENVDQVFRAIADDQLPLEAEPRTEQRRFRLLWPSQLAGSEQTDISDEVERSIAHAVNRIEAMGFEVVRTHVPLLSQAIELIAQGGITAYEAFAFHRPFLKRLASEYEPFTLKRLGAGEACTPEQYESLLARRLELIEEAARAFAGFDAILQPASLIIAPLIAQLESDEEKIKTSIKMMVTTVIANILDQPSISIPCHESGSAPVGLLLTGTGSEEELLLLAKVVERALDESNTKQLLKERVR